MKWFAGIQAVTFDVGNTLIAPWPSVGHVYAEVAAAHGHGNCSAEALERRFRAAFHARGGLINTKQEWSLIVDETFAGLLSKPPSESFFPELYERFAQAGAWRIFEDVVPTLAALRQRGLKLGVISNWDDRLRPLLKSLQIADQFDVIVVSCEVGASKPASAIFRAAVKQLGVPACSLLHVGDSFAMDVLGARAAGLHAVQIERQAEAGHDSQIKSLLDLRTWV
jgi:putative hydrolase of the HAD superfamily